MSVSSISGLTTTSSQNRVRRKPPPTFGQAYSPASTAASEHKAEDIPPRVQYLSCDLPMIIPLAPTYHGSTKHLEFDARRTREPHYRKRASLMPTDISRSSPQLPFSRLQDHSTNGAPVDSAACLELEVDGMFEVDALLSPGNSPRSVSSSHTGRQSLGQGSTRSYSRVYLDRELPPLPTGVGSSIWSSTTGISYIEMGSSTRINAETGGIYRPTRSSQQSRLSCELFKCRPSSSVSRASSNMKVLTTREAARQNIRHAISESTATPAGLYSVNITADDLFTDAEVLEDTENVLPTDEQLSNAASLEVISENGINVPFGDLWSEQKTVVCFIRHFWCPLCQDYMFSISKVNPARLRQAGVDLVIISNGSHKMSKAYRRIFRTSFALYVDPSLRVYHALGMTLRTLDGGLESERGQYVQHGTVSGIAMVVRNAMRVGMPVWEKGGDIQQLGGEFVLGPGLQCSFAHRMRTTRAHRNIKEVLGFASVQLFSSWGRPWPSHTSVRKYLSPMNDKEGNATRRGDGNVPGDEGGRGSTAIFDITSDNNFEMDVFGVVTPTRPNQGSEADNGSGEGMPRVQKICLNGSLVQSSKNGITPRLRSKQPRNQAEYPTRR